MKASEQVLGERLLRLAMRMTSNEGVTIPQIQDEFGVSRATAFRMKRSVVRALAGRTAYEAEPPDDESALRWRAKKESGRGRDWTHRIYEDAPLAFNDVGLETLRALEVAQQRLKAEDLTEEAAELALLAQQIKDRLDLRSGTNIDAENLLQASGGGTRVSVAAPIPKELLRTLQNAIVSNRSIRFRYYLRREHKHRTYRVDPLGVIFHRFSYLACIDHKAKRDGIKTFRLPEIDRLETLPGIFKPPSDFDLEDFTQQSFGVYHGGEALDVVWRFKPSAAEEASKFAFHPTQTTEREKDGSLLVRFRAKGDVEMCWELMTWGNDVEIVAPDSLKETYISLLDDLNEVYENLLP